MHDELSVMGQIMHYLRQQQLIRIRLVGEPFLVVIEKSLICVNIFNCRFLASRPHFSLVELYLCLVSLASTGIRR